MTNEELVALIQAGERDRMEELWRNVERFVWQQAARRILLGADGVTVEDLYQSGYLALVDAVKSYDAGRGMSFIGWLALALRTAFAEAAGRRSRRQSLDPLHQAVSADAPAYQDEAGPTVAELVPDESASLAFLAVEWEDCRGVIEAALDSLPGGQGELLRSYYLRQEGIDAAAAAAGYVSRHAAYEAAGRALYRLAHGKYTRALRGFLDEIEDFREYQEAADRETWKRTGLSRTEAGALANMGRYAEWRSL